MNELTKKYYSLANRSVYKAEIRSIINLAKKYGHQEIENKLRHLLRNNPKEKKFKINKVSKLEQEITNDALGGLDYLNQKQEDQLGSDKGLGKAVSPNEIYQYITDLILKVLESGEELPWRKPWVTSGITGVGALNYVSKKSYRGINSLMLNYIYPHLLNITFDLPYFLTFKQVQKLKGKVRAGSKAYRVFYFTYVYKSGSKLITEAQYRNLEKKCAKGAVIENGEDICASLKKFPIVKYYNVFCADDIEGIDFKLIKDELKDRFTPIESAEGIVSHMPKKPKIEHKGDGAYYMPVADRVVMPLAKHFESDAAYYTTLFHELSHSTMHKKRLNDDSRAIGKFGDMHYAFEELVAELSAVFLCSEAGILFHTLKNSQSYLKSWSSKLIKDFKDDNKLFFRASSKAQASADFILDRDKEMIPAFLRKKLSTDEFLDLLEIESVEKESKMIDSEKKSTKKATSKKTVPTSKKPKISRKKKETGQLKMVLNGKTNLESQSTYDMIIGGSSQTDQYGILGQTEKGENIALNLDETNTISLFGVQGGGKSYSIGTISEMVLKQFPRVNQLPSPLAGVIFHYSESMDYEPEFTSMKYPNNKSNELELLRERYGADPDCIDNVVLLTPKDKVHERKKEYPSIEVLPITFNSTELNAQDWMFILGAVGNDSDYVRKLKSIMKDIRRNLTIDRITEAVEISDLLSKNQKELAKQKLSFASQYIDDKRKPLRSVLVPGKLVIVDMRDEFVMKDEALGLFVIMMNIFSAGHGDFGKSFNKFIVFDEAHKYMDDPLLTDAIVRSIREMRHKGVSLLIASQDPPSLPKEIIELSSVLLLHKFNSPQWLNHIKKSITQIASLKPSQMSSLKAGEGFLWATKSYGADASSRPIKIFTRPRVTLHGGGTLKASR